MEIISLNSCKIFTLNITKHFWDKEDSKWRDIWCLCIGRLATVKMLILSKFTYKHDVISIKIPANIFHRNCQDVSNIRWIEKI